MPPLKCLSQLPVFNLQTSHQAQPPPLASITMILQHRGKAIQLVVLLTLVAIALPAPPSPVVPPQAAPRSVLPGTRVISTSWRLRISVSILPRLVARPSPCTAVLYDELSRFRRRIVKIFFFVLILQSRTERVTLRVKCGIATETRTRDLRIRASGGNCVG